MLAVPLLAVATVLRGCLNDRRGTYALTWAPTAAYRTCCFPDVRKGKTETLQQVGTERRSRVKPSFALPTQFNDPCRLALRSESA